MSVARWRLAATALATAVLAVSMVACGRTVAPGAGGTPAPPTATTPGSTHVPAPVPTSAPARSPVPAPAHPVPPRPSAAGQLAGFFAAAATASDQLKRAAVLVNQGMGKSTLNFSPQALAAVKALDTTAAARAIPAGLPPELLRQVLLVYSDLVSRHLALDRIWFYRSDYPMPRSASDAEYLYRCMGNGAPAAARFAADLSSARALAARTPPVTPPAPDSRPAAELAVRIYDIGLRNSGCGSCGGYVSTTLARVVWEAENQPVIGQSDGYVNGVRFRVTYHAGRGWDVMLWAC